MCMCLTMCVCLSLFEPVARRVVDRLEEITQNKTERSSKEAQRAYIPILARTQTDIYNTLETAYVT